MNLAQLAADIASRIPAMAKDSPINNAMFIEKLLKDAPVNPAEADIVLIQQKQIERLWDARNAEQTLRMKAEKERDEALASAKYWVEQHAIETTKQGECEHELNEARGNPAVQIERIERERDEWQQKCTALEHALKEMNNQIRSLTAIPVKSSPT